MENNDNIEVVWLKERRCFATLVERHAYFSVVIVPGEGVEEVENDDYETWSERVTEFESE